MNRRAAHETVQLDSSFVPSLVISPSSLLSAVEGSSAHSITRSNPSRASLGSLSPDLFVSSPFFYSPPISQAAPIPPPSVDWIVHGNLDPSFYLSFIFSNPHSPSLPRSPHITHLTAVFPLDVCMFVHERDRCAWSSCCTTPFPEVYFVSFICDHRANARMSRARPPLHRSAKPPTATASTTTAEKDNGSSSGSSSSSGDTNSTTTDSSESKPHGAAAAASADGKSRHKWPLRPGVHVHVNGLHAMHNNNNGKGDADGAAGGEGTGGGGPPPPTASRGTSTSNGAVTGGAPAAASDVVDGRAGNTSQGRRARPPRAAAKIFPFCLARIPREWALALLRGGRRSGKGRVMNFAF